MPRRWGEFQVPDGIDALVKAAKTERDDRRKIRRAEAWPCLPPPNKLDPAVYDQVLPVLLEASQDPEPPFGRPRPSRAGSLPGEKPAERLEHMLTDAEANVRFNAATMLASEGQTGIIHVLVEMLDPNSPAAVKSEEIPAAREQKRSTILVNALRATEKLADKNPTANLSAPCAAVAGLTSGDVPEVHPSRRGAVAQTPGSSRRHRGEIIASQTGVAVILLRVNL